MSEIATIIGSLDAESILVDQFERAELGTLSHADHVRVAWAYLLRDGRDRALSQLATGLARFAAAKGAPGKFHLTMTRAWLDLIVLARTRRPDVTSADQLLEAFPELADARTVGRCYRPETLASERARLAWVEPDVLPLASIL